MQQGYAHNAHRLFHSSSTAHIFVLIDEKEAMSDHFEGHFPEEAEQNEIGGPVLFAIMILAMIILLIWAFA